MQLIDDFKKAHKFASVIINAIGATLFTLIGMFPDNAYALWMAVPDEVKSILPSTSLPLFGASIFVLGIVARVIKQTKLYKENGGNES